MKSHIANTYLLALGLLLIGLGIYSLWVDVKHSSVSALFDISSTWPWVVMTLLGLWCAVGAIHNIARPTSGQIDATRGKFERFAKLNLLVITLSGGMTALCYVTLGFHGLTWFYYEIFLVAAVLIPFVFALAFVWRRRL